MVFDSSRILAVCAHFLFRIEVALAALPLGTGSDLAAPLQASTVSRPSSIIWTDIDGDGDFDGDGDLDLVGGGRLTWFENDNGLGTSWTDHPVDPGFSAHALAVIGQRAVTFIPVDVTACAVFRVDIDLPDRCVP